MVKVEPIIKEEPIETSQFDEQTLNHTNDSVEHNSENEIKSIKAEEIKSMFYLIHISCIIFCIA